MLHSLAFFIILLKFLRWADACKKNKTKERDEQEKSNKVI